MQHYTIWGVLGLPKIKSNAKPTAMATELAQVKTYIHGPQWDCARIR